jgi:hypothetical protein
VIAPSVLLGAIGQPTATATAAAGRTVTFVAMQPTAAALVDGLVAAVRDRAARTAPVQSPNPPSNTET